MSVGFTVTFQKVHITNLGKYIGKGILLLQLCLYK